MKYIKKITPEEFNNGLRKYFDVATVDDFWEVKGAYALDNDLCWSTTDDNCFYLFETANSLFVYFAMDKGRIINMKGLFECFYEIVCSGYPFIRVNGLKGRYTKLFKAWNHWQTVEPQYHVRENEELVFYAGHPENIEKIKRRFN